MRSYDEFLAGVFDVVDPGWLALLLLLTAVVGGLLWYFFPAWVPRRLPRFTWRWFTRKPRAKKAPKRAAAPIPQVRVAEPTAAAAPQPAVAHASLADRLAAEGRYAEAIRERLRDSVATMTRLGVIPQAPEWTVRELAATASANRPAVAAPLTGATDIFSQVWYGLRPAGPDNDAQMRRLTAEVDALLEARR